MIVDFTYQKMFIFQIITHKEARSGKRCPLKVDGIILEDLQLFARHLAKVDPQANPNSYLFTTFLGREISPTVSLFTSGFFL